MRKTNPAHRNPHLRGERTLFQNAQWEVTNKTFNACGDAPRFLALGDGVRGEYYWFPIQRLGGPWIEHLLGKVWVDPELFEEAYRFAASHFRVNVPDMDKRFAKASPAKEPLR